MTTPSLSSNGHRRRELVKRVLAEETHCALCDKRIDKTLKYTPGGHHKNCPGGACQGCIPHPLSPEVDETLPRSRGGSQYDRNNTRLMHRACNRWKYTMTLDEARTRLHNDTHGGEQAPTVTPSPIW